MPHAIRFSALVIATCASAIGQVVPVSGGGAALANAVATAPNNAVLVVAPGTYSSVAATVAKNVTIVAPQGATISGDLSLAFTGAWRLTVDGLTITPFLQFPQVFGGVLATNGALSAENCQAAGLVVDSSAVVPVYVRGCSFGGVVANNLRNVDAVLLDTSFVGYSDAGQVGYEGLRITGAGSLRAERCSMTGMDSAFAGGNGLETSTGAVLVDCTCTGGLAGPGQSWSIHCTGALTLSNCTTNGPVSQTPTLRTVPSAAWVSQAWTVGGTSQVLMHENATRLVLVLAATDLVPWSSPLATEKLWVGATPDWFVSSFGVTDGGGNLVASFTIPNAPVLQFRSVWLTGAFVDTLPFATTCPLGGVVH